MLPDETVVETCGAGQTRHTPPPPKLLDAVRGFAGAETQVWNAHVADNPLSALRAAVDALPFEKGEGLSGFASWSFRGICETLGDAVEGAQGMTQVSLEALVEKVRALSTTRRQIVVLAGPPAAGKSHMAEALEAALNARGRRAAILAMDGYHYDDAVLRARERLAFKGAPDTFDVGGFEQMLGRLAANAEAEVAVPVFDRGLEISRGSARIIEQETETLIVEGNYLLFKAAPWGALHVHYDMTVFVTAEDAVLRTRLRERWQAAGLEAEEIRRKVEENDLPNCKAVIAGSVPAQFTLHT